MEKTLTFNTVKKRLSRVLDEAEAGARITVTKHDRAVALIVAVEPGLHVGRRSDKAKLRPALRARTGRASLTALRDDREER